MNCLKRDLIVILVYIHSELAFLTSSEVWEGLERLRFMLRTSGMYNFFSHCHFQLIFSLLILLVSAFKPNGHVFSITSCIRVRVIKIIQLVYA